MIIIIITMIIAIIIKMMMVALMVIMIIIMIIIMIMIMIILILDRNLTMNIPLGGSSCHCFQIEFEFGVLAFIRGQKIFPKYSPAPHGTQGFRPFTSLISSLILAA